MLNTLNINLKTDIKTDRPTALGIKLMSQDKNNNQFILRFTNGGEPVTLDDTYTVEILTKFSNSGASRLTSATVRQDYATWQFDTEYITQDEMVYIYVYVRKAGSLVVSADANAFYFDVGLSEIDKNAGRVAEVYDENYQKYLDEFKDNVDFEEIAQAEQARKEAELLREENYNQKVDTAIVEADVVSKVDNKVTELTPQISNLTAQLAQNVQQLVEVKSPISKVAQTLVTFISDDGQIGDYTILKPLFDAKGIKCVSAISTAKIGLSEYMNESQIRELYNDGWEIASHGVNHVSIGTLSTADATTEIVGSFNSLNSMGFDCENIVYPYGSINKDYKKIVSKYYKCGVGVGGGENLPDINTWQLGRNALGSYFDGPTKNTYNYYKGLVDKAIADKGWLIFMLHPSAPEFDAIQLQALSDVIDYCIAQSVPIKTLKEGLSLLENPIQYGNNSITDGEEYFSVDINGRMRSKDMKGYTITTTDPLITSTTLPSYFQKKYTDMLVKKAFALADNQTFPLTKAGVLETYAPFNQGNMYQIWRPNGSSSEFIRWWYSAETWSAWVTLNNPIIEGVNKHAVTDAPSSFIASSITYTKINTAGATGFPNNKPGTLVTDTTANENGYTNQLYYSYNNGEIYYRYYKTTLAWSDWVLINDKVKYVVANPNAYTSATLITGFPDGMITNFVAGAGNATGFPGTGGGICTTYRIGGLNGYDRQEFRVYNTNQVWSRYTDGNANWTAWVKISVV